MLFLNHIVGNELTEIQSFKFWNYAGEPTVTNGSTKKGLFIFDSVAGIPKVYDGTAWRKLHYGVVVGDLTLSSGYVLQGNGSNLAAAVLTSSIALSAWGAATANVSMGTTYKITNLGTPTVDSDAATKAYVDSASQGFAIKGACVLLSNLALPRTPTYATGTLRLTAASNAALTSTEIDSGGSAHTLAVNDRVILKNQATASHNGIYIVIQLGSGALPYILERSADCNTNVELVRAYALIEKGTYISTGWVQSGASGTFDITVPSGTITFEQFTAAGSYSAGNGINIASNVVSLYVNSATTWTAYGLMMSGASANTLTKLDISATAGLFLYNVGTSSQPAWSAYSLPVGARTANQLLYCSSTTAVAGLATANTGYLSTDGGGVPSIQAKAALTKVDDTNVTLTLGGTPATSLLVAASLTLGWTGTLAVGRGGTGQSSNWAQGGVIYASSTTVLASSAVGTSQYFLLSGGTGAPTFNNTLTLAATGTLGLATKVTADTNNRVELYANGDIKWGPGNAITDITLGRTAANVLTSIGAHHVIGNVGAAVGELRMGDADNSAYVGLKSPDTVTTSKVWTLPVGTDTANFYLATNGSGVLSFQQITAAHVGSGAALTKTDDTNVTLTLGGTPASALLAAASLTLGWSGTLAATRGGTGTGTYALGDTLYSSATNTLAKLAGNITVAKQWLAQTGTGAVSAAPVWSAITAADVTSPAALTRTSDTNVTLTIGTANCLVTACALTVGWSGTLAVSRGGLGTATYVLGDLLYSDAANSLARLAGNTVAAKRWLRQTGTGTISAAPAWDSIIASDIGSPASLTKTDDTNVTLSIGTASCLVAACALTVGWTGSLAVGRGGTGQTGNWTQWGMLYASTTGILSSSAAPTAIRQMLFAGSASAPTWSAYAMPASVAANDVLYASSTTAISTVSMVPARAATGLARKRSAQIVGDGTNAYISVTHNLGTIDVVWSLRKSASSETPPYEFAITKCEVIDTNTIRFYFAAIQAVSDYYVVTIIG